MEKPLTIQEAQAFHDTYGTLFIVDGDRRAVAIYDDQEDADYLCDIDTIPIE